MDDVPESAIATKPQHEERLHLKDLDHAIGRLPIDHREALIMQAIQGMSYEAIAEATGSAVGTAKSRVFRARRQLEKWLAGEVLETADKRALAAHSARALA